MHKLEKNQENEPSVVDVFSKLGNNLRFTILIGLKDKNMKTSEILEKTNISVQALHKQIMLLIDSGLVSRYDGRISLTEFGKNVMEQIPALEFLSEHKEYFQHHTIRKLPTTYLETIGSLRNGMEIHGAVRVLEKTHSIIQNAEKYLKSLIVQYSIESAQNMVERIKKGNIIIHYVMGHNTIIPKGRDALLKKTGWNNWSKDGIVKGKMVKNLDIMLIMSDTESLIFFPDNYGMIQLDSALYSTDKLFHNWCNNLFDDIWKSAQPLDEKKIHE